MIDINWQGHGSDRGLRGIAFGNPVKEALRLAKRFEACGALDGVESAAIAGERLFDERHIRGLRAGRDRCTKKHG